MNNFQLFLIHRSLGFHKVSVMNDFRVNISIKPLNSYFSACLVNQFSLLNKRRNFSFNEFDWNISSQGCKLQNCFSLLSLTFTVTNQLVFAIPMTENGMSFMLMFSSLLVTLSIFSYIS